MEDVKGTVIWTDWPAVILTVVFQPVEGLETVMEALLSPMAVRVVWWGVWSPWLSRNITQNSRPVEVRTVDVFWAQTKDAATNRMERKKAVLCIALDFSSIMPKSVFFRNANVANIIKYCKKKTLLVGNLHRTTL
jgi:hypothetical protein